MIDLNILKRAALADFSERTTAVCVRLGHPVPRIAVADPRARWGSCRQARPGVPAQIRYSWRVALAPPAVADYLVAHECAHLVEANHGPRFWALVDALFGDHTPHRAWLRREGASPSPQEAGRSTRRLPVASANSASQARQSWMRWSAMGEETGRGEAGRMIDLVIMGAR